MNFGKINQLPELVLLFQGSRNQSGRSLKEGKISKTRL